MGLLDMLDVKAQATNPAPVATSHPPMELDARGRGSAPPMTVAGPSYRQDAVRYVADNLESCVDELLEAADADKREGLHDEVQDQLSDLLSELAASD